MPTLSYTNKKTLFDITVYKSHCEYASHHDVIAAAKPVFKRFAFQKEECPKTKEPHWQFRGALYHQEWANVVIRDLIPKFPGNWSLTSTTVHKSARQFNYVMKEQSRLEGPWTDKDQQEEPPKMTRQLEHFMEKELYPWQQQVVDMLSTPDDRSIILIYDKHGNSGKSIFAEYLEYKELAFELPPMRAMEDILQFAFSFKDQECYLVDMPRGMKKDKLADFYAGLECLKNGVVWDKRYAGKKRRMNRPNMIVFTNMLPVFNLMSPDRWITLEMMLDRTLRKYHFSPESSSG